MSYENLLTERCSIFHLVEESQQASYGVPGETEYNYPAVPDLTNVSCLFGKESIKVIKDEPGVVVMQTALVHFLLNTDVRFNDKVVKNGISYRLEVPRNIRGHHIEVMAVRDDSL